MISTNEALKRILEKCEILLENEVISNELLMRSFADFLLGSGEKKEHNVGVVLHTGSVCFDALMMIYAVASCMVYNKTDASEIIESLRVGDSVLYGEKSRSRYIFEGVVEHPSIKGIKCVKLSSGSNGITYAPASRWHLISPYMGTSTRFDGRGIRKLSGLREHFYKSVFEYEKTNIPAIVDTSVVLVMPRDRAEFLLENIQISFDGVKVSPLELVTASYFTENDEYRFGGNVGKNEANIKITGKVSVARSLVLRRDGNKHLGVIISGNEIVVKGQTEIPELLRRRSLQYVYVNMNMDSERSTDIINEIENPYVFVCSKEFLLSNSLPTKKTSKYCQELSKQVDAIIDRDIEPYIISGNFSWHEYKEVKKSLLIIKNSDFIAEGKEEFLIQSYSLINLFLTSVFKMSVLEKCISDDKLEIVSPINKIADLSVIKSAFPDVLQTHAETVLAFIEESYKYLDENSEKENYLRELLTKNTDKKIAVIVPKAYYATLLRESGCYDIMDSDDLLTVVTANRFDNSILYDHIVVVGNFNGKRFDTFRCRAAQRIETLLYDFESHFFKYKLRSARKTEHYLNSIALNDVEYSDNLEEDAVISDEEILEVSQIDSQFDEYITRLNEAATFRSIGISTNTGTAMAEVIAIADFDSGEKALFTKNYKAYVFNEDNGTVAELKVSELSEGDSIVFAQRNSETRDIVDSILSKLVTEKKVNDEIIECYIKSKAWKGVLQDYMKKTELSVQEIAEKMIRSGVNVQEITIRGWLDEDSHTVGPRNYESIQQIGLLVGDADISENAHKYHEACSVIRKVRREILKQIGEAIINKLCGKLPEEGTIASDVYERIDSIALLLRLESITFVEREVPLNFTNRPISL